MAENRRSSTRHTVSIEVTFVVGTDTNESWITNLSLGGAQLKATKRYSMGERVRVTFQLPTSDDAIDVGGTVRWSDGKHVGVQFDGLRARDVWALNEFFKQFV